MAFSSWFLLKVLPSRSCKWSHTEISQQHRDVLLYSKPLEQRRHEAPFPFHKFISHHFVLQKPGSKLTPPRGSPAQWPKPGCSSTLHVPLMLLCKCSFHSYFSFLFSFHSYLLYKGYILLETPQKRGHIYVAYKHRCTHTVILESLVHKILTFSRPQFPYLWGGDTVTYCGARFWRRLNGIL